MELVSTWLYETYQFLASIKVPGFDISFIQLFIGAFCVVISIGFARMFFGLGGSAASFFGQHGGNNKNIKVSEERKGDKK